LASKALPLLRRWVSETMPQKRGSKTGGGNSLALPLQVPVVVGQAQVEVEPHGVQSLEQLVVAARAEQPVDDLAALAYAV
jgi:hypothetical protein